MKTEDILEVEECIVRLAGLPYKRPKVIGCKVIFKEVGDVLCWRSYGEYLWNYLKFLV